MSQDLPILINNDSELSEWFCKLKSSTTIAALVIVALQMARLLAVKLVEHQLAERANEPTQWPNCPDCGAKICSKGRKSRQLDTLIGTIHWERRCGRCPNKCRIGQVAPLDEELGIQPNQKSCQSLKQAGCSLAVFVSYEAASVLLTLLTGVTVSSTCGDLELGSSSWRSSNLGHSTKN